MMSYTSYFKFEDLEAQEPEMPPGMKISRKQIRN